MNSPWIVLIIMTALFSALFLIAELLFHWAKLPGKLTRKIIHIGTGLLTLLFPVYFTTWWQILVICMLFLVILLASMRWRLFPSIHSSAPNSAGSWLFPITVIIIFYFFYFIKNVPTQFQSYAFFYIPILIMAICDPVAALVGGSKKNSLPGKTVRGSIAFFITSFLITITLSVVFNNSINQRVAVLVLFTLAMCFITTLAERVGKNGWDNFVIPIAASGVIFLYEKIII